MVKYMSAGDESVFSGKRHDEEFNRGKIRLIGGISFLMGFTQALFIYVMSTYFKQASGTENIGIFYLISYSSSLIIFFNLHKIIKVIGKSNSFYFSLFAKIITVALLLNFSPSPFTAVILIFYIILGNLEWLSLDIIIESLSVDAMSGRIRGKYLTILNAGFLLGPFISTRILESFDFRGVFMAIFLFNAVVFIIALLGLRHVNHKFEGNLTVRGLFKKIVKRKNILRAYYISFVLEFFYALMVIYTPIYLRDIGMSWQEIGTIFTFMLLPFVVLQYPVGLLADKKLGEKELLIFSLTVMAICTSVIYFIGSKDVWTWSIVLFATRIGASLIEVLRDSYFFKRIDGHDVDVIDFFRTAQSSAYILASIVSVIILSVFPIKAIFILISGVVFSALYPAAKLTDNKCEQEMLA